MNQKDRSLSALSAPYPSPKYPNEPPEKVNPARQPYGHWTGRCGRCQSRAVTGEFIFGCDAITGAGVIITKDGPKYGLWKRK